MECCLAKGELLKVDGGKGGLELRCTSGAIWLTCGDGGDYLLTVGRSHAVPARRVAMIEALATAAFCLGEPAAVGETAPRQLMGFTTC